MGIFNLFAKSKRASRAEILNKGLEMSIEFGKEWRQPIQPRLAKKKYKFLSKDDLDQYDLVCRPARDDAQSFIYNKLEEIADLKEQIENDHLQRIFSVYVLEKYEWVRKTNLNKLFSQGCYYAWRDGLTQFIKS